MQTYLKWKRLSHRIPGEFYGPLIMALILFIAGASCNSPDKRVETMQDLQITQCGTVQFAGSCGEDTDSLISLGLALIHNMTYEDSERLFDQVMEQYPDCFWGPWGKAMTHIHPLWAGAPSESILKSGWDLSLKTMELADNEKQKSLAAALAAYYENGINKTEQERLKSFHSAWDTAYQRYPDDLEIKSFYALSLLAVADPNDNAYKNQLQAGKLAEEIIQQVPEHPGGIHYTIHAYDYPELADKAIAAAEKYSKIAPEVAHALHMPTHIYTRLGMWEESIAWNRRSAQAALKQPVQGAVSMHYFHALDYLVYAHLQRFEDAQVQSILQEIRQLNVPFQQTNVTAYTLAAVEGRYALERQNWTKASQLTARHPASLDWDRYPEFEALSHFAIGLGSARSGEKEKAALALKSLENLRQKIQNPYWANQLEIQAETVRAWLYLSQNQTEAALESMRNAAKMESATSKHPITPGELLPANELLGDMLMELGKPGEALLHYEQALTRSPGRYNSLYGAAKSAEAIGDTPKANRYRKAINKLSEDAEVANKRREYAMSSM